MTEETTVSNNSAALAEFEEWRDSARDAFNQLAITFVKQQKQMIANVITDKAISFGLKLQLLEKHTGHDLFLDNAAGLCSEDYDQWKQENISLSAAQQRIILELLQITILEWLEDRYPLYQMVVGVIGVSSIEGREVAKETLTPPDQITVTEVDQNKLPFDPWMRVSGQRGKPRPFNLSVRTNTCLQNDNIDYLGQLVQMTEGAMLRVPNFGRKSLDELKVILGAHGARFGMDHPDLDKFNEDLKAGKNGPG